MASWLILATCHAVAGRSGSHPPTLKCTLHMLLAHGFDGLPCMHPSHQIGQKLQVDSWSMLHSVDLTAPVQCQSRSPCQCSPWQLPRSCVQRSDHERGDFNAGNGVIGETGGDGRTIDCEGDCDHNGYISYQCVRDYPLLDYKGPQYDEEGRQMYCAAYYDPTTKTGEGQGSPGKKVSCLRALQCKKAPSPGLVNN